MTNLKLRHGEGSIEQRGDRYRAKWYGMDGSRRSKTFPSRAEAAAHLLEVSGRKRQRSYRDPSEMTVYQAAEEWLERGARRWSGGTEATYRQRVEKHILPVLGEVKVAALTTHRIQVFADRLRIAPNTAASVMTALSGVLSECVRLGVIERNPAQGVRLPSARPVARAVWDADAARKVLAWVKGEPRWHALYHLALSTGMRPGELRALQWGDIDFEQATVTVQRTVTKSDGGGYAVRESTKSGRARTVSLPLPCVAALRVWKVQHPQRYIFGTDDHALKATTWVRWHRKIVAGAGVPDISLHGMRHSAATLLLERGVHPKVVSEILGHTSIRITLDIYSHVDTDMQRAAMASLADVFSDAGAEELRQAH